MAAKERESKPSEAEAVEAILSPYRELLPDRLLAELEAQLVQVAAASPEAARLIGALQLPSPPAGVGHGEPEREPVASAPDDE